MKSEIAQYLQRDHNYLDSLFFEFKQERQNNDMVRAQEFFLRFRNGLLRHMGLEEEILFKYYEKRTGKKEMGLTAVLREEHNALRDILERMEKKMEDQEDFCADELELFAVMDKHSLREEDTLYAAIDIVTSEEEKLKIFVQMKNYQAFYMALSSF